MDEFDWASSVGHVRILEKSLLSAGDFSRLADAESIREVASALRDTVYGSYLSEASGPAEISESLERGLAALYRYLLSFSPEPGVLLSFVSKYDFHNLKVLARELLFGTGRDGDAVSPLSIIPYEAMRELARVIASTGRTTPLTLPEVPDVRYAESNSEGVIAFARQELLPALADAFVHASGLASGGGSFFELDSVIDRTRALWQTRYYARRGYRELLRIFADECDLTNLKMSLRAYYHGIPGALLGKILLPGTVSAGDIAGCYSQGPGEMARAFANTPWAGLALKGIALVERRAPLGPWEKECDEALAEVYRTARMRPLGPEPVVGLMYAREVEASNLRTIFSAKRYGLPRDGIVPKLRKV